MTEETYQFMKELISIAENSNNVDKVWLDRCKLHCDNLKTWKPEIYILLLDDDVHYIVSNSPIYLNLFNYNEERIIEQNPDVFEKKYMEWKAYLEEGINNGTLIKIL